MRPPPPSFTLSSLLPPSFSSRHDSRRCGRASGVPIISTLQPPALRPGHDRYRGRGQGGAMVDRRPARLRRRVRRAGAGSERRRVACGEAIATRNQRAQGRLRCHLTNIALIVNLYIDLI